MNENIRIQETQDNICELLSQGSTLTNIIRTKKYNFEEVYSWLESHNHPKFQKKYNKALEIQLSVMADTVLEDIANIENCEDKELYKRIRLKIETYKWYIKEQKKKLKFNKEKNIEENTEKMPTTLDTKALKSKNKSTKTRKNEHKSTKQAKNNSNNIFGNELKTENTTQDFLNHFPAPRGNENN